MNNQSTKILPDRPEPVHLGKEPFYVHKKSDKKSVSDILLSAEYVMIEDMFPTGLNVLSELKKRIFGKKSKSDFKAYRDKRTEYHLASNCLLVPIENNQIALRKSPEIGWLEKLYPDLDDFILPFPQVQGLNSSWQWYIKGIKYPVLKKKIYPYYGTYFPTRFDHLILFDNWLKKYTGSKGSALDMGTGCGVLAFQLLNRGFKSVYATDINPNAIISVAENAEKFDVKDRLDIEISDLFKNVDQKVDLIVFNSPWLPAKEETSGLDQAIYYQPGLFERFFKEAGNYLVDGGKVILLFSNLGQTAGVQKTNPIEEELKNHNRFKKIRFLKRKVAKPSRKTKRKDHRKGEYVELWELTKT